MIIFPAIDLLDGMCVRLQQGLYDSASKVAEDAVHTAESFISQGATFLHVVDLNGAKSGCRTNFSIIEKLAKLPLFIQTGGGIRDLNTIENCLSSGVSRVILGSAAIENPDFLAAALAKYGDSVAVGIDADGGQVKTRGWVHASQVMYLDFAKELSAMGVKTLIYTDIAHDGMLDGVNLSDLTLLTESVACDIIASGGVSGIEDIKKLAAIPVSGAICGKSLYTGKLDLRLAIDYCKKI